MTDKPRDAMTAHRRLGATGGGANDVNSSLGTASNLVAQGPRHNTTTRCLQASLACRPTPFDVLTVALIRQRAAAGILSPELVAYLLAGLGLST